MENNNWEEDWEDNNWEEVPQKTSKKVFGIPLAIFIALVAVVVLVTAAVIYNYIYVPYNTSFTKNVTVSAPIGGGNDSTQNVYVSVIAQGDISSSVLNCDLDGISNCVTNTGNIMLVNSDPNNAHTCSVITTGDSNVITTYTGITNPVTVPALSNVTFRVNYESNVSGSYPMTTTINCP
jgi:hypothetical protein